MSLVLCVMLVWIIASALLTEFTRMRLARSRLPVPLSDTIAPRHPRTGQPIRVLQGQDRNSPLSVIGWRDPVILMHPTLPDWLNPAELRCALVHEAAHIANHDAIRLLLLPPAFGAALMLALTLLVAPSGDAWLDVMVGSAGLFGWWAAYRHVGKQAEIACDALAARHDPLATASALIKSARLASRRQPATGRIALADRNIAYRISLLLDCHGERTGDVQKPGNS